MKFSSLTFDDSGMYQCIAENHHGVIYANAELRVFGESNFGCSCVRDLKVTFCGDLLDLIRINAVLHQEKTFNEKKCLWSFIIIHWITTRLI